MIVCWAGALLQGWHNIAWRSLLLALTVGV